MTAYTARHKKECKAANYSFLSFFNIAHSGWLYEKSYTSVN